MNGIPLSHRVCPRPHPGCARLFLSAGSFVPPVRRCHTERGIILAAAVKEPIARKLHRRGWHYSRQNSLVYRLSGISLFLGESGAAVTGHMGVFSVLRVELAMPLQGRFSLPAGSGQEARGARSPMSALGFCVSIKGARAESCLRGGPRRRSAVPQAAALLPARLQTWGGGVGVPVGGRAPLPCSRRWDALLQPLICSLQVHLWAPGSTFQHTHLLQP